MNITTENVFLKWSDVLEDKKPTNGFMAFVLGGDSYFKNVIPLDTSVIYEE